MKVQPNHPLAEILARKLFSIEICPPKEQRRIVQKAIKAAVIWAEEQKLKGKLIEGDGGTKHSRITATG